MIRNLLGVFAAVICLLCGIYPQPVAADQFHAILIGDTNDSSIGESAVADIKMAEAFANGVGRYFDAHVVTILAGDEAFPGKVKRAIQDLDPGSDDFVFLYYTGHGNSSELDTPWPRLDFGGGSVEALHLVLEVQEQGPFRLLAMFDACNGSAQLPPGRRPASAQHFRRDQIQRLFKTFVGNVILTSSDAPYVSYASADGEGSIFSTAFFATISDVLTSPIDSADWSEIAERVSAKTSNMPDEYRQIPKYEISDL